MKFNVYNRTTKQQEEAYADNAQALKSVYASVGEEIEIVSVVNEHPNNNLGPATVPEEIKKLSDDIPDDGKQVVKSIVQPIQVTVDTPHIVHLTTISEPKQITYIPEKYFTDNGIEYKITAEGSFKKSWVDVDSKLFRVINSENSKEIKLTNKKIQTLDWVKIG